MVQNGGQGNIKSCVQLTLFQVLWFPNLISDLNLEPVVINSNLTILVHCPYQLLGGLATLHTCDNF